MPRRRIVRILLFPILAVVFLIGWLLYAFGKARNPSKKEQEKKPDGAKKAESVEIGLLGEAEEEEQIPAK
ncbi:MAG: hypothetical protein ACE14S_12560 [Candidatus Bathyarchaeia archaeon]